MPAGTALPDWLPCTNSYAVSRRACSRAVGCSRDAFHRNAWKTSFRCRHDHSFINTAIGPLMFDLTTDEWVAIVLSLRIAIVASIVALPFGIATAWLLARKNFWGKTVLDGIVHLPLVLPPVVTGYLLLISFGRRVPIGAFLDNTFGIVFSFRWTGAALACGVMGFPLLVRAIRL